MSEKLTIKKMIQIAIEKDLPIPDETSGLVEYHSYGLIGGEDESVEKRVGLAPTEHHLSLINEFARTPQTKDDWEVYTNCDPIGNPQEIDSHGDVFDKAALRDMAKGAPGSPILTDHNHELGVQPPMGICIAASVTKDGRLIETWAFPKEDYNSGIRMGLDKGLIRSVSVGIFVSPRDKICNSCGDKSIYSGECPHYPGDKNGTSVTIKRVKRYAERSLVNIPARLGTSVKGLAPETKEPYFSACEEADSQVELPPIWAQSTKKLGANDPPMIWDLPLDYDEVYLQFLIPEGKDLTGANGLSIQNFVTDKPLRAFKFKDTAIAKSYIFQTEVGDDLIPQLKIDHNLFPDNESVNEGNFVLSVYCSHRDVAPTPPATIPDVISEDSIVAEKDVKAPEAQEPSEKEEITAPEATAAEDKTEAPVPQEEVKSIEVPVVKSLEVEELTKSFNGAIEVKTEELNKALAEVTEKLVKQQEFSEKQGEALKSLSDSVVALAENVAKLASLSTEEAVEKLLEVAGQIKEQTSAPKPQEPMTKFSFIDSLRK